MSVTLSVYSCPQKMPVYQINRLISGTFHQGDIRFGNTAGLHGIPYSLYFGQTFAQSPDGV